eukprot:gnl/MRDRNA2_/MRDRNA2_86711_c7_seq6.p1 gnl/MRDRNA2_/MRDRNA2_86711_c7~~gnl/MRDRNA2_/MRDRNA2_86711_c7_seq6.p1  ORF type:complete len:131 (-),score=17.11 gnl/MRDRNA2_/MRDRNA2_86711_c7_seq6:126-518(-)
MCLFAAAANAVNSGSFFCSRIANDQTVLDICCELNSLMSCYAATASVNAASSNSFFQRIVANAHAVLERFSVLKSDMHCTAFSAILVHNSVFDRPAADIDHAVLASSCAVKLTRSRSVNLPNLVKRNSSD